MQIAPPWRRSQICLSLMPGGLSCPGRTSRVLRSLSSHRLTRSLVVSAAEAMSFSVEDVAKIEMAVGEACTNIIEHAYITQPLREEIDVFVQPFPDRLEVTLRDYSTINFPIDDTSGIALDDYIDTQRRRGLGLYIIRTFVDLVEHRFICGQGNELKLVKYRA